MPQSVDKEVNEKCQWCRQRYFSLSNYLNYFTEFENYINVNKVMKVPRQRSNGYEEFGFTLAKHNNKYVAICKICNRTLQNTAFIRLRGHRNVCRPPALDRSHLSYTAGNETLFVTTPNEYLPRDVGTRFLFDCPNQKPKLIPPVAKNDFPEAEITYPPYNNAEEDSAQSQTRKKQTNLKKLAVLEIIKQHKHTLFEDPMADSAEIWMKALKKAQSLGLASENQHWTFARDSFEMWKNRTLAKKECLDSDGWNDKLDIVDMAVLQIIDKNPIVSMDSEPNTNSSCSAEYDRQSDAFPEVPLILPANDQPNAIVNRIQKIEDVSTQTFDELYEAEVRKKRLECEILEIEVYKKRLEALKLERELCLPPSTITSILFGRYSLPIPTEFESKELKRWTLSTENVKFEIGGDD